MKKHLNIFLALAVVAITGGCSKENPFDNGDTDMGQGTIMKSSLSVLLENEEGYDNLFNRPGASTRAVVPTADDFTVSFYEEDAATPVKTYQYSEMPEVVTLPAGAIKAVATYGDNAAQDWESPYYKGETQFIVVADRVTDDVDPITARLANVRVTIAFAPGLKETMSADSKVTVVVGESGTLDFTTADEGRSGYFAYVENSTTLTATFRGQIDGFNTVESKGYDNVAPGNHYRITFKLHDASEDGNGDINGGVTVDATVEVVDMNISVDPDEDVLEDDMRPTEGDDDNNGDNGDNGNDDPNTDPTSTPAIEPIAAPDGMTPIVFDEWNTAVVGTTYCKFKIKSSDPAGFQSVKVKIVSEKLSPEELSGIGLTDEFDLADPADSGYWEALAGLGFPTDIKGLMESEFDITGFLPMIVILGTPSEHKFVITVTDANGVNEKTLMLRFE